MAKDKNYGGTFKEPEHSDGVYQLAQSGLYESSHLRHGQIQATYPGNAELRDVEPEQGTVPTPKGME